MFYPGVLLAAILLLGACGDDVSSPASVEVSIPAPTARAGVDSERLARGEQLYRQNCMICHGEKAAGDPNWRKQGADGRFPPPPLDGSAHTWHHPWAQLHHMIKNGGPAGQSNMPPWKDKLSDQQINDIILWFQSLWSDDVYQAWYRMDQDAKAQAQKR